MSGDVRITDLQENQQRAVRALLEGKTLVEAAQEADVTDRTLRRWRRDETFMAVYERETAHQWREAACVFHSTALLASRRIMERIAEGGENADQLASMFLRLIPRWRTAEFGITEAQLLNARLAALEGHAENGNVRVHEWVREPDGSVTFKDW